MDLEGAVAALEHASELQPENVTYLALLSKQYTDMSFAPGITTDRARQYNEKALEVAEKIVALKPKDPAGHVARGVCKGRLAYFSDNRTKIELAKEAEESVRTALELNGDSDLGHHLMGRFQYEMAGLNLFCRAFVRVVYGTTLSPGSYQHALEAFEKAHSLRPDRVIHKVLLGKTYDKLGYRQQALESLQDALKLDVTDINDHLEQLDGQRLVENIKKRTNPFRSQ